MAKRSPQTAAKREREQAKREKRERKAERRAAAAEARLAPTAESNGGPEDEPAETPLESTEPE
jgi:hypothetical protein